MRRTFTTLLTLGLVVAACSGSVQESTPESLTLIAHDSFVAGVTDETFASFTEETGIEVEVLAGGDAGSMVTQAVLTKDNPLGDVLFGVDDTFLSRAVDNDIFVEYRSSRLGEVPDELRVSGTSVTPISYGDVCFNYDIGWFANAQLVVPDDLDDLLVNTYAQLVTVEHPATSSPGLAFMLATIALYGEDGWLDWWETMSDAGINVVSDWDTAYYADFTRYGGDSPIVMSYASSPPAEVIFSETPLDSAPTGVIEAGCYRQVEYAGILAGTSFPDSAGELIDFMLSEEFQETVPLSWFVFPANENADLPADFVEHTTIPSEPARLDPSEIAENRDRWIDEWVKVMEG